MHGHALSDVPRTGPGSRFPVCVAIALPADGRCRNLRRQPPRRAPQTQRCTRRAGTDLGCWLPRHRRSFCTSVSTTADQPLSAAISLLTTPQLLTRAAPITALPQQTPGAAAVRPRQPTQMAPPTLSSPHRERRYVHRAPSGAGTGRPRTHDQYCQDHGCADPFSCCSGPGRYGRRCLQRYPRDQDIRGEQRCLLRNIPIRLDDSAHTTGCCDDDRPIMFNCPNP